MIEQRHAHVFTYDTRKRTEHATRADTNAHTNAKRTHKRRWPADYTVKHTYLANNLFLLSTATSKHIKT